MIESILEMYSPEELEQEAAGWESENYPDERRASEYNWQYIQEFPLSEFLKPSATPPARDDSSTQNAEHWVKWFADENDMSMDEYGMAQWKHLADEEIQEPVLVSYNEEGQWHIWDGWHRTAASFAAGRNTIPAIVGTPK